MATLTELEGKEALGRMNDSQLSAEGRAALLLFTPFCGTCKVAERMLEIVQATEQSMPIYKLNLNFASELAAEWRITSVPCLVVLEQGIPVRIEYAMRSVDYLFKLLSFEKGGD